ncbi:hypothetical protein BU15DRAFT_80096 [Melanogaster broomeanus]|nr:hypothetical protein BU15DRAFT_80096 [Melanogaster broomeanus]
MHPRPYSPTKDAEADELVAASVVLDVEAVVELKNAEPVAYPTEKPRNLVKIEHEQSGRIKQQVYKACLIPCTLLFDVAVHRAMDIAIALVNITSTTISALGRRGGIRFPSVVEGDLRAAMSWDAATPQGESYVESLGGPLETTDNSLAGSLSPVDLSLRVTSPS